MNPQEPICRPSQNEGVLPDQPKNLPPAGEMGNLAGGRRRKPRRQIWIGQKFYRLTVVAKIESPNHNSRYLCLCECGGYAKPYACSLNSGNTRSCGCLQVEGVKKKNFKHGSAIRGKKSKEYMIWVGIIRRCFNSSCAAYKDYGGREITVCERWRHSFPAFYEDMGPRPPGMTLDRRDNNLGYCKENCRWTDYVTQNNNRRDNHWIEIDGERNTIAQWARKLGIGQGTIHRRIKCGWNERAAVMTPIKKK